MRRYLRYALLGVLVLVAVQAALAALFFGLRHRLPVVHPSPVDLEAHPPLLEWSEHDRIYSEGDFPRVLEIETDVGSLLYVGVLHTGDPDHPQFDVLRRHWTEFDPTVALNEGRAQYVPWFSMHFGAVSDPMLTYRMAKSDGIPIYSLEPSFQGEVDALLEKWEADLIACYFALRVITTEAGGDPDRAEAIAPGLIAKRTDADGLRGTIKTASDIDDVWSRHLPDAPDWRTITNLDSVDLMRTIGDDSRIVRGEHMIRSLVDLVQRGERVVAVVGASHVIRQERVLQSILKPTPE